MKLKKIIFLLSFLFLLGCTSEDDVISDNKEQKDISGFRVVRVKNTSKTKTSNQFYQEEEIMLQFKDDYTFNKVISEFSSMSKQEQQQMISNMYDFESIKTFYDRAMREAESYYDRPGGYEQFKAKYFMLDFPEIGDDYSAYLPYRDDGKLNFVNVNGNVMIGDKIVPQPRATIIDRNPADVVDKGNIVITAPLPPVLTKTYAYDLMPKTNYSYDRLKVGGSALEHDTGWMNVGNGKKIKVTFGRIVRNTYYLLLLHEGYKMDWHIEISFRKKGFLGKWYNYSSGTDCLVSLEHLDKSYANETHVFSNTGDSSHDYYFSSKVEHLIKNTYQESHKEVYDADSKNKVYVRCLYRMPPYRAIITIGYRGMPDKKRFIFENYQNVWGYLTATSDKLYD